MSKLEKQTDGRFKFVQFVALFDRSKIQSI